MQFSVMYGEMMGVNNVLNYEARLNSLTMMCELHLGDDQWFKRWMFTDEATFHVRGRVNTHNCLIWGTENSHVSYERLRTILFWGGDCSCRQLSWHDRAVYGPSITASWDTGHHYLYIGWRSTALGYNSEVTIKPHIQRSLMRPWWTYTMAP